MNIYANTRAIGNVVASGCPPPSWDSQKIWNLPLRGHLPIQMTIRAELLSLCRPKFIRCSSRTLI